MVSPSPSWQAVLQTIIKMPGERQRLSTILGVTAVTISRWAHGETTPHRSQLLRLTKAAQPQYREALMTALEAAYPDIQLPLKDASAEQIPSSFFAELLSIRTTTTEALRFWRISEMVLKQALALLDPNELGMAISVVQCMPPVEGKIRSLRETAGKGTLPWAADLENLALFLGMESLAGYSVETRHIASVEDLSKDKLVPAYQTEFEVSAAAHPIWLGGLIAGCLLASSTQVGYFSQQRLALLATFSDLISLALTKDDFYPPSIIALRLLPGPEKQRPILVTFRQRVSRMLIEALQHGQHIRNADAERLVWQEIEEQLLSLPDD